LDGIRTFAVFGVFCAHWGIMQLPGFSIFPLGQMGVTLFFVLSGYLITGILISAAGRVAAGERTSGQMARRFYARRFLRIFPIYYLILFITAPLILQVRQAFWWHLTYTSNVYFAIRGSLDIQGAIFWTLAAEEQFYLIWPWIILFADPGKRRMLIVWTIGLGLATRALLGVFPAAGLASMVLLPGCLPLFGLGALAASQRAPFPRDYKGRAHFVHRFFPILGLVLFGLSLFPWHVRVTAVLCDTFGNFGWGLVCLWIVRNAASGFEGLAGRILQSGPMVYLGRISYGLYIYHTFVTWAICRALRSCGIDAMAHSVAFSPLFALATVGIATASWFAIEQPINRLKRFYPY